MTEQRAITIRGEKQIALENLETNFAVAVRQRELLEAYIKERLKSDKHFYRTGEGENRKPSLTKEGAELICLPHVLKPYYDILSGPEAPPSDDSAPYQITVRCELRRNGQPEGQGLGSASSHVTKKDNSRVVRQKDPGLRHNATLKMACKSAYIAATLNATAASEFFTQDLENGAEHQDEVETSEHWCAVHKTAFFKRGKMTSFAHPIGDTGQWCHEAASSRPAPEKDMAKPVAPPVVVNDKTGEIVEAASQSERPPAPVVFGAAGVNPPAKDKAIKPTLEAILEKAIDYNWDKARLQAQVKSKGYDLDNLSPEQAQKVYTWLAGKGNL